MRASLRSWQQKKRKFLAIVGVIGGYLLHWGWTGITAKTLWDWLNLLGILAIPAVVGFGSIWFTNRQAQANDAESKDNQRESALQAYIDKMSELLLKGHLEKSERERVIARARTLTVLRRLDAERKGSILRFLQESKLIYKGMCIIDLDGADLSGADLSEAYLSSTLLRGANLIGANLTYADLSGADMYGTKLSHANMEGADMSSNEDRLIQTDLSFADLSYANLTHSNLSGALLGGVVLTNADLTHATLTDAKFRYTTLTGADLSKANLTGATGISNEELEKQTKSLKGATMPDGSIHP